MCITAVCTGAAHAATCVALNMATMKIVLSTTTTRMNSTTMALRSSPLRSHRYSRSLLTTLTMVTTSHRQWMKLHLLMMTARGRAKIARATITTITITTITAMTKENNHQARRCSSAGYRAIVAAQGADKTSVASSSSLQALSSNYDGHEKAALVEVGTLKVGVIAFTPIANASPALRLSIEVLLQQLQDEAACLRGGGVELVVLVSNGDPRVSDPVLLTAASGLVDLIIGVGETGAVDCAGAWHNESSDGTAMVLVHDSPQYVGIVRVSKNQHGLSFQSSHTII